MSKLCGEEQALFMQLSMACRAVRQGQTEAAKNLASECCMGHVCTLSMKVESVRAPSSLRPKLAGVHMVLAAGDWYQEVGGAGGHTPPVTAW